MKEKITKWLLSRLFVMLVEGYDKYGEEKVNEFISEVIERGDELLEVKLGKEKATQIEKEFLDLGENYIATMKKEMED